MGLVVEHAGKIAIFIFTDSSDAGVDDWAAQLEKHIRESSGPFYAMVDVSSENVEFTAYARRKTSDLFPRYRDHVGYIAFIFSGRTAPFYARIFFAGLGRLRYQIRSFNSRTEGLSWLQSRV